MYRFVVSAALVGMMGVAPTRVYAQSDTDCAAGQLPQFVLGFANLKAQVGEAMGDPVTCEFPDPNGTGDVHQRTSSGLAFWRKATNTPTFTNGFEHWAATPGGWLIWTGSAVDPPGAYPPMVIDEFVRGCTSADPNLGDTCQCAIGKMQQRYTIDEFVSFGQRYTADGVLPAEVTNVVVECVLMVA